MSVGTSYEMTCETFARSIPREMRSEQMSLSSSDAGVNESVGARKNQSKNGSHLDLARLEVFENLCPLTRGQF